MPKRPWSIVWVTLSVLSLGALGIQDRRDLYSCDLCRARKVERIHSVWGVPLEQSERAEVDGDPGIGHRHDWWRYSSSFVNGPYGALGRGSACHTFRYKDRTN